MGETTLLPNYDGATLTRAAVNDPRAALRGNVVPRNSVGVPQRNAGSLGTPQLQWGDGHFAGDVYVKGRSIIGGGARSGIVSASDSFLLVTNNEIRNISDIRLRQPNGVITEIAQISRNTLTSSLPAAAAARTGHLSENITAHEGIPNAQLPTIFQSRNVGALNIGNITGGNEIAISGGADMQNALRDRVNRFIGMRVSNPNGDEYMIIEVDRVHSTGAVLKDGFRGSQIQNGSSRAHNHNSNVTILDAQMIYMVATGINDGEITATPYVAARWIFDETNSNDVPDDVIVVHRQRDDTLWRRAGGAAAGDFEPYQGAFVGIALVGENGTEVIMNGVRIDVADRALATPFIGGEFTARARGGNDYRVARRHDPCIQCIHRGNFEQVTYEDFTNTPTGFSSGDLVFAYAGLGNFEIDNISYSSVPPVPIDGGDVGVAYVHPNQLLVCIAAFIVP